MKDTTEITCPHCRGGGKIIATLGARIAIARQKRGLGEKDLAQKVGVSATYVRRYEQDLNDPSLHNLKLIAEALEVSPGWLLSGEGELKD